MKEYRVLRYFMGGFIDQKAEMEINLNSFAQKGWELKATGWNADTCTLILEREATPPSACVNNTVLGIREGSTG